MPRTTDRFEKYLYLLQGNTKDKMLLPIAGFNPMGKELASEKLEQLIRLDAEDILADELNTINEKLDYKDGPTIGVAINLIDDLEGSWSDHYTTDYKSKFEIEPLIKRNFCTPVFWTSEMATISIVRRRIREYVYRTRFVCDNKSPQTLREFVEQEVFVYANTSDISSYYDVGSIDEIEKFYLENVESNDYSLIFNFFYGDSASKQLAFASFGIEGAGGQEYIQFLAMKSKQSK